METTRKKKKKSMSSLVLLKLFYQKGFVEFMIRSVRESPISFHAMIRFAGSFIFLAVRKLFDL